MYFILSNSYHLFPQKLPYWGKISLKKTWQTSPSALQTLLKNIHSFSEETEVKGTYGKLSDFG